MYSPKSQPLALVYIYFVFFMFQITKEIKIKQVNQSYFAHMLVSVDQFEPVQPILFSSHPQKTKH